MRIPNPNLIFFYFYYNYYPRWEKNDVSKETPTNTTIPKLNLENWDVIESDNKNEFYSKLRYCLRKIINGYQATGANGHDMRRCIANELFRLKAPLEIRIDAFKKQKDFEREKTEYQVKDLEKRARSNNNFYISSCKTIKKWGFCFKECSRYKKLIDRQNRNQLVIIDQKGR